MYTISGALYKGGLCPSLNLDLQLLQWSPMWGRLVSAIHIIRLDHKSSETELSEVPHVSEIKCLYAQKRAISAIVPALWNTSK